MFRPSESAGTFLTFWRRNYFFLILAHPVYKMWITQEPNTLELWNKLHFEDRKTESIYHVQNIQYLYWTDYKTNLHIAKELEITSVLDKLLEYERKKKYINLENWMLWDALGSDNPQNPTRGKKKSVLKNFYFLTKYNTEWDLFGGCRIERRYRASVTSYQAKVHSVKSAIHSQLKWAILLCDVIPDRKTE